MSLANPILTAKVGTNADLFPDILKLYVPEGSRVLDMTYGKGVFWRNVDKSKYVLVTNDLLTEADYHLDFRNTGFAEDSFDAVILDPPYGAHGTPMKESINSCYQGAVVEIASCAGVMNLYHAGIKEAQRLLRQGGILILKVQDEIESGKQKWKHAELLNLVRFTAEDMFVLVQASIPAMRHTYQKHARKNHSYFIVHRKVAEKV